MSSSDLNFLVIFLSTFVFLLTYHLINTVRNRTHVVPIIKASNSSVHTGQLEKWIEQLKDIFDIKEYHVAYRENYKYYSFIDLVDKKKKTINICKWNFNSVGYEIDYLFASMWSAAKIIKKDKTFKRLMFLRNYLSTIFVAILLITTSIHIIFCIFKSNQESIIVSENFNLFLFYEKYMINQIIGVTCFVGLLIIIYFFNSKFKNAIESKYEREIAKFVKDECVGYNQDIVAARQYSVSNSNMYCQTVFYFSKSTNNLAYLSPFCFQ